MDRQKLKNEWHELAPNWVKEVREGSNANRQGLLDDVMLDACGNIQGLRALDCGCGEGRFSRMLVSREANSVLGVDLSERMIEAARDLQSARDSYEIADAQDLGFIEDEQFDLAISYLNQCDLLDIDANNREIFRVLKPTGRFVIANLHPMRSAVGNWQKDEDGSKKHVILDRYFDETERHWKMLGVEFTNFHRTLATYTSGFLEAGFIIEGIIEPTATNARVEQFPELEDELRVPNFIVYCLRKP